MAGTRRQTHKQEQQTQTPEQAADGGGRQRSARAAKTAQPARASAVRVDAQRNRQHLIEVARAAFTSGEGKVSLEAIARAAGVGIGTLYRHFPTREALVEAVYRAERTRLCDSVDGLLAEHAPERALRLWMDGFADYIESKREMAETLRALVASGAITKSEAREELSAAIQRILDAGAAAGTLRGDVRGEDPVVALVGIVVVCPLPEQREQAGRLMDLLMDSLRTAAAPNRVREPAP